MWIFIWTMEDIHRSIFVPGIAMSYGSPIGDRSIMASRFFSDSWSLWRLGPGYTLNSPTQQNQHNFWAPSQHRDEQKFTGRKLKYHHVSRAPNMDPYGPFCVWRSVISFNCLWCSSVRNLQSLAKSASLLLRRDRDWRCCCEPLRLWEPQLSTDLKT